MKKKLVFQLIFLFLFIFKSTLLAQYQIEWAYNFGGTGNEIANSVALSEDGGYVIAGYTLSNDNDISNNRGEEDLWIIKLDSIGNLVWEKTYGGSGRDRANAIQSTTDGGYIIAGSSESFDGDVSGNFGSRDCWVIKIDSDGNLLWENSYGSGSLDVANYVIQDHNEDFVIVGIISSINPIPIGFFDFYIVKIDPNGDIIWEKNYGGSRSEFARHIQQTDDKGYIITGSSSSFDKDVSNNYGNSDYWIIKIDEQGNLIWEKNLGGSFTDRAYHGFVTNDGGFVAVGFSASKDSGDITNHFGRQDCWVTKLNTDGVLEWQKKYGGTGTDIIFSAQQNDDNTYSFVGRSTSSDNDVTNNNGDNDIWIFKTDTQGNLINQQNFGGNKDDVARDFKIINDTDYILVGESMSNNGDVKNNYGGNDFWVIKLTEQAVSTNQSLMVAPDILISPNPSNDVFEISVDHTTNSYRNKSIKVQNQLGQIVYDKNLQNFSEEIDLSNYPAGVYYVTIRLGVYKSTRKIIKQ